MKTSPMASTAGHGSDSGGAQRAAHDDVRRGRRANGAAESSRSGGQRELGRRADHRRAGADGALSILVDRRGRATRQRVTSSPLSARNARDRRRGRARRTKALALHRHRLYGQIEGTRPVCAAEDGATSGRCRTIILWDRASVSLGVGDPRGIARAIDLNWNGQRQRFVPGSAPHRSLRTRESRRRLPA